MKTAKEILIKKDIKLNPEKITGKAWDEFNIKILEVMEEYAEHKAIEFSKWLSAHEQIVLIDGNWYHRADEDGDHPFSEEELYEQFQKQK